MKSAKVLLTLLMLLAAAAALQARGSQEEGRQPGAAGSKEITLTYWYPFVSKLIASASECLVYQEMEKRTGIKIEFIHPPVGEGETEANFNLMIASGDLPDMIYNPSNYPGGPDKAVADGYYLNLVDLIDKHAPHIKKVLEENPEIRRQIITDQGNIWGIPTIQLDKEPPWSGPFLRGDWLRKLNLKVPETIDEWERVLTAFRDHIQGCEAPLLLQTFDWRWGSNNAFAGAYGAAIGGSAGMDTEWLNKDGQVAFGPLEPGYRDFLALFHRWYEAGLIDKDFATRDNKSHHAMFTSGRGGVFISGYGDVGPFLAAGRTDEPDFDIVPAPMPILKEGAPLKIRQSNPYNREHRTVITTSCKYPEEAMKWLDYAFTDEGFLLFNYGVEGITYDLVSVEDHGLDEGFFPASIKATGKKPVYNEFMTNNPDGYNFWDLMPKYKVHHAGMLRNPLSYVIPEAAYQAMEIWSRSADDWVMPVVVLTEEESKRFSAIMSEARTYYQEMTLKFIMGIEPLDKYDDYIGQLKRLDIEEAIRIQQAALDRYNRR